MVTRAHRVEPGECLTRIAVQYGFTHRKRLAALPANQAAAREPNLLRPGTSVELPEHDPGAVVGRRTGARHRFVVSLPSKELCLVLKGHDGRPLVGVGYVLELGLELREGSTDRGGRLVERIPLRYRSAVLTVTERRLILRFSHLEPLDEHEDDVRAVQARLHNLGFDVGPTDGLDGQRTRVALALFQQAAGLDPTGEVDTATRDALRRAHGC